MEKTEKSNVYSLMTRLNHQTHLKTAPAPRVPLHPTPSFLKRVQTRGVIKAAQVKIANTLLPPTGMDGTSDASLIALQNDFKEITELQSRLHFMLKDLESFLGTPEE